MNVEKPLVDFGWIPFWMTVLVVIKQTESWELHPPEKETIGGPPF